jgi:hypothetical protein
MGGENKVVHLFPEWQAHRDRRVSTGSDTERRLWLAMETPDDLGFILRVHILFENALIKLLQKHQANVRRGFQNKLHEALKARLLSEPMIQTLSAINEIRNKFAHELDYELTEEDVDGVHRLATVSADAEDDFNGPRSRFRADMTWVWTALRYKIDPVAFCAEVEAEESDR